LGLRECRRIVTKKAEEEIELGGDYGMAVA